MADHQAFDLDAIAAEATREPFQFVFGGNTYEIPVMMDLRVGTLLEANDWGGAVKLLVGPQQWDSIVNSDAVLNLDRAVALVNAYASYIGTSPGK